MALDELRQVKLDKLKVMRDQGIDPYPATTQRSISAADALARFDTLAESKEEITLAGRVMARSGHGGSIFFDLNDGGDKIQGFMKEDVVGAEGFKQFKDLYDIGDI